jgi:glycosyltransferase involved in cell wall biosynthesis
LTRNSNWYPWNRVGVELQSKYLRLFFVYARLDSLGFYLNSSSIKIQKKRRTQTLGAVLSIPGINDGAFRTIQVKSKRASHCAFRRRLKLGKGNRIMSPLNVLLVVYAFPPAGGVGVLRAASLARYFPAEGIRLDVLTTRNPSSVGTDQSLLREIPLEVQIHRTITLDLPFGVKKRLKSLMTGSRGRSTQAAENATTGRPGLLKRVLQDLLLPDPQVTWLPVLTRAARRIVKQRKIDLVLITGAPFSDYLLAERLRKDFPQLPIVLDFRDEWLATSFGVASFQFSRSERARKFAIRAEAAAVANATAVVAVTEAARREIRGRYPWEPEGKFLYVPNGFDATRLRTAKRTEQNKAEDKIVVTYVGTVYSSTEPTALVEALQSLPPAVKERFTLRFIGHIEEPRYQQALLQLGGMVELKGYLPQREALEAMNETDYVLLVTHDPLNISAKFYDYIGAGKPILACVHPEGDVRRLLEDLRAGWWANSHDVQGIRQLFLDTAARHGSLLGSFQPDSGRIRLYERKVIAHDYAELLYRIAGREHVAASDATTARSARSVG